MFAGMTANHGKLNLEYLRYIGFSKIQPYDEYITDSAAGVTAIATGVKTYNGAISVNPDTVKVQTILELAEEKGLSTGLVTTCDITDATPAAFIAHQKSRDMLEAIAMDYLKTDVDLVIGGGLRHFANRRDGQLLIPLLQDKGYTIITDETELTKSNGSCLFNWSGRGRIHWHL
jgi:alkaline phosphatase